MANILTAIPDLLGKLGNEHFSADVQGKHIALLKEQFGVFLKDLLVPGLQLSISAVVAQLQA
jgi:hypothetical protein